MSIIQKVWTFLLISVMLKKNNVDQDRNFTLYKNEYICYLCK